MVRRNAPHKHIWTALMRLTHCWCSSRCCCLWEAHTPRPSRIRCSFAVPRAGLLLPRDLRLPAADTHARPVACPGSLACHCEHARTVSSALATSSACSGRAARCSAHPLRRFAVNCASQTATMALAYDINRCCTSLPPAHNTSLHLWWRPVPDSADASRFSVAHL